MAAKAMRYPVKNRPEENFGAKAAEAGHGLVFRFLGCTILHM
jgi:hypothetical protein